MSWGTLSDIKRENREEEERAGALPKAACPVCGDVLQVRGNVRNCAFGHYRVEV